MNANRRKKAKELIEDLGFSPKQAYEATKGIVGKRKPKSGKSSERTSNS